MTPGQLRPEADSLRTPLTDTKVWWAAPPAKINLDWSWQDHLFTIRLGTVPLEVPFGRPLMSVSGTAIRSRRLAVCPGECVDVGEQVVSTPPGLRDQPVQHAVISAA